MLHDESEVAGLATLIVAAGCFSIVWLNFAQTRLFLQIIFTLFLLLFHDARCAVLLVIAHFAVTPTDVTVAQTLHFVVKLAAMLQGGVVGLEKILCTQVEFLTTEKAISVILITVHIAAARLALLWLIVASLLQKCIYCVIMRSFLEHRTAIVAILAKEIRQTVATVVVDVLVVAPAPVHMVRVPVRKALLRVLRSN